ncbi:hypothetical protein [Streptomyces chromofuscus]|uniref:Uncharacterized protein n=1 Tax=Streptomyces chromofuscus TaxID=42881 RepID=A0A7M2TF65_STRCW|nr:hypothetical protein [Streptomyces chromofuscus]QOV46799.1 hypothetical protein IPT68_13465 [Streptomyces chromofuscus]GGT13608.1 hypothetical protein GCM10010254_37650 [Streptomyces chromofuscus]
MPNQRHPQHFACGQLHAALWTLRLLAVPGQTPPTPEQYAKKDQPSDLLKNNMAAVVNLLCQAKGRGNARAEAAVAVFRELPDLLPANGRIPTGTMSPPEQNAFADGYRALRADHEERFGDALK